MFSVLFSLLLILMALCYWKAPQRIIAKRFEYILFFLLFGAGFCFLHGVSIKTLDMLGILDWYSLKIASFLAFPVLLFAAHLLYPFKNVNGNLRQHVNFFLFFATLLSMAIAGFFVLIEFNMK
jgi:hypothetical protein